MGRGSSVGIAIRYGLEGPGSNPGGDEILGTLPNRTWGPPSLLHPVSLPEVKQLGLDFDHPSSSSAEVEERVELYIYIYFPSGSSWRVLG